MQSTDSEPRLHGGVQRSRHGLERAVREHSGDQGTPPGHLPERADRPSSQQSLGGHQVPQPRQERPQGFQCRIRYDLLQLI